jgi:hypothetical protein
MAELTLRYFMFLDHTWPRYSRKQALLCELVEFLQVLSLVIPVHGSSDSPWRHDDLGVVWTGLHIISRPDSLFCVIVGVPLAWLIIIATVLGGFYLTGLAALKFLRALKAPEFQTRIVLNEQHTFSFLVRLHKVLFGVLVALRVPILASVVRLPTNELYQIAISFGLVLAFVPIVLSEYYSAPQKWTDCYLANVKPRTKLYHLAFICAMCLAGTLLSYETHSVYLALLFIGLGFMESVLILVSRPYYEIAINFSKCAQGGVVALAGAVLAIYQMLGDKSNFVLLVFFVTVGPLAYILKHFLGHLTDQGLSLESPTKPEEFERLVRKYLREADKHPDTPSLAAIKQRLDSYFEKSALKDLEVCQWTAHFSTIIGDLLTLKLSLASMSIHSRPFVLSIRSRMTLMKSLAHLRHSVESSGSQVVVAYHKQLEGILSGDKRTCIEVDKWINKLSVCSDLNELREVATKMVRYKEVSKAAYKQAIKDELYKAELYTLYSGFLISTENVEISDYLYTKILNAAQGKNTPFDENACLILVSLEQHDFGVVTWTKNCHIFGYLKSDLVESKLDILLPDLFREGRSFSLLDQLHSAGKCKAFVKKKEGGVSYVSSQLELVVLGDGRLSLMLWLTDSLKAVYGLALLNSDSYQLEYSVSAT